MRVLPVLGMALEAQILALFVGQVRMMRTRVGIVTTQAAERLTGTCIDDACPHGMTVLAGGCMTREAEIWNSVTQSVCEFRTVERVAVRTLPAFRDMVVGTLEGLPLVAGVADILLPTPIEESLARVGMRRMADQALPGILEFRVATIVRGEALIRVAGEAKRAPRRRLLAVTGLTIALGIGIVMEIVEESDRFPLGRAVRIMAVVAAVVLESDPTMGGGEFGLRKVVTGATDFLLRIEQEAESGSMNVVAMATGAIAFGTGSVFSERQHLRGRRGMALATK